MNFAKAAPALLLIGAVGLTGCQSTSRAFGMGKVTPDEFRVVTKAPLVLPPDFSLRPPSPGQPRPQELQPESAAQVALLGQQEGESRSDGEKMLSQKAGGDHADPLIRYEVDDEFGSVAHKDKSFADWVTFWKKGDSGVPANPMGAAASTPAPVDAAAEAERLQKLTGNQPVVIARKTSTQTKLPGL